MAGIDFGEGLHKVLLFGVGAFATGTETAQQVAEDLGKWGVQASEEMLKRGSSIVADAQDAMLRARLEDMDAEERAAYAQKIDQMMADIDAKAAERAEAEAQAGEAAKAAACADEAAADEAAVETEPEPTVAAEEEDEAPEQQETTEG